MFFWVKIASVYNLAFTNHHEVNSSKKKKTFNMLGLVKMNKNQMTFFFSFFLVFVCLFVCLFVILGVLMRISKSRTPPSNWLSTWCVYDSSSNWLSPRVMLVGLQLEISQTYLFLVLQENMNILNILKLIITLTTSIFI